MPREIQARTPEQLVEVTGVIHDHFFCVDRIMFDQAAGLVTIPFLLPLEEQSRRAKNLWLLEKVIVPRVESAMLIYEATGYRLVDTEQVGCYDFNELRYDQERGMIVILTGIPLALEVDVTDVHVVVRIGEKTVDEVSQWQVGGWLPK